MKLISLDIEKMVGIDKVSLSKEDLGSGINLIFGPNGSGKTSICKAITRALWPETMIKGERLDLRSLWHTENGPISINLETNVQKASSFLRLPPSYLARCFVITIDDLFDAKDQDLATRILQEAHGGYDPEEVRKAFTLKQRHGRDQTTSLLQAKESLRKVESQHAELAHQEKNLQDMALELEDMKKRIARKGTMQSALKSRHLESEINDLSNELESFPLSMDFLKPEDKETLQSFRRKETDLTFHVKKLAMQIQQEEEKLNSFTSAITAETLALYEKTVQEIHHLSASLDRLNKEKSHFEVGVEEKLALLRITEEDFSALDVFEIEKMARIYLKKEEISLQEKELYARLDVLVQESPSYPTHVLLSGIAILKSLSISERKGKIGLFWILGSQGVFFLLAGLFVAPVFFLGLIFPYLTWQLIRKTAGKRNSLLQEYSTLGLPALESDNEKEIYALLDNLLLMVGKKQRYELDSGLIIDVEKRLAFLEEEKKSVENELESSFSQGFRNTSLTVFVEEVKKTKEEHIQLLQKKKDVQETKKALDKAFAFLEEIAPSADLFGFSLHAAQVALEALRKKRDDFLSASYQKKSLVDERKDKLNQLESLKKEIESFFEKRKIVLQNPDDELGRCLDLLSVYSGKKKLLQEKRSQKLLVEKEKGSFPEIFEKNLEELTESLLQFEALEKNYEDVLTEKAQLEERIQSTQKGHELSFAKKQVEHASKQVEEKMKEASLAIMGEFLLQKVEASYRQESSLVVFDKVCEYFSLFTKGRYIFKAAKQVGKETEFFVEDTHDVQSKKLINLSRGTRMQLLLAVRIAFSDLLHNEPLPLFLDEALHTADQERFEAIASVLFELASKGRQIFYLTSKFSDIGLLKEIGLGLGKQISYIDLERKKSKV